MAMMVAMLTPIVRGAAWVDRLPIWCQWYLRPAGDHTVFTLLPWAGFVFAGGAAGASIASAGPAQAQARIQLALAGAGVAIFAFGLYAATLPTIYRQSSFWTNSPTFFAVRVGVLLLAPVGRCTRLLRRQSATTSSADPFAALGRASLFVYWVHVQMVYGCATWPLHHRLQVWQALVAFGLVSCRDVRPAPHQGPAGWLVAVAPVYG